MRVSGCSVIASPTKSHLACASCGWTCGICTIRLTGRFDIPLDCPTSSGRYGGSSCGRSRRKLRIQWHAPFDERQVAGEVFIIRGDHRPDCRGCHRCPCCERRLLGSVEGWVSHREPSSVDFNEIGRASCRERVESWVVDGSLKEKAER